MKKLSKSLLFTVCGFGLLISSAAQAHYIWLEPGNASAMLYFGEVDAQLRENSPGKLDKIDVLQAFAYSGKIVDGNVKEIAANRKSNHFLIESGSASTVLAREESVAVVDLGKHKLGMAKSNYYARMGLASTLGASSPLALDIAQGNKPNVFIVSYRGVPLQNAKVEVIAPNTWMQEHHTNAQGIVNINTPWRGLYVVHVLHVDPTPGEFSGKAYDNLRNHLTYTFMRTKGADAGPVQAPMHLMD